MEIKKKNIVIYAFWFLIVFAIYSIFSILKTYAYNFNIKGFDYALKPITVNFELKEKYSPNELLLCFNDYCSAPSSDDFYNVYNSKFDENREGFLKTKVKNIYLAYPYKDKNFKNNIKNIDLHIGNDNYYYKTQDIAKFNKKSFSVSFNKDETKKYEAIELPKVNNYKGLLSHLNILFLSLFYNWQIFIVPYFWLFVAYLIYSRNKDKFNFKINNKVFYSLLGLIFLIGIILRIVDITYYPLWTDEVYTSVVALENFKTCFQDPGNPPLFFILEYLFTKIFSINNFTLRFLPFVFGSLFPLMVYILFKNISKPASLFASFLAVINIINIYHSQEARGYSLCMLLSIAAVYLLFKYLKNPNNKNLIFYGLILFALINTNYYLILFSFTNFIWGVVDLLQNNNKNKILKFALVNFICVLTFIPYYIFSSANALSSSFNGWIPELNQETFLYIINSYFINKYIFLILAVVLLINIIYCFIKTDKVNKEKENLLIYLIYSFVLILILASGISLFIKPIIHKRVLLSLYGLFFLIEAITIISMFEVKKLKALYAFYVLSLTLFYFSITAPMPLRQICNLYDFMNFIVNDSARYDSGYEIHAITCDTKEYLRAYPKTLALKNIQWHFIDTNNGSVLRQISKKDYVKSDKKAVIYFNSIGVDTQNISLFNPNVYLYLSNLTTGAKLIYNK